MKIYSEMHRMILIMHKNMNTFLYIVGQSLKIFDLSRTENDILYGTDEVVSQM